ncbi:hypothetical protein SAMN05518845_11731 [Variovorax sp. YR750]|uniref:hypothetical protein n=1 Tax=Variovorax sp. YR750 TaxID=1884384 RepID=UPI0008C992DF|nr:hypothetical protein [Variovorax sp. YR750]SEM14949.1 hypothetical protein SAMN05518845_11731 [Variovorax sp. YR750]
MIIARGKTRVGAWLDAISQIDPKNDGGRAYNVVVEVAQPSLATAESREAERLVDSVLVASGKQPLVTVAETIFPMTEYRQGGMKRVYEYPETIYKNIAAENPWGTYALRLVAERVDSDGETYRPLEAMINKMRRQLEGEGGKTAQRKRCFYELDVGMPAAELKLYDPDDDAEATIRTQCLSHLSFKFGKTNSLYLTAMYRSQYFVEKALGNYRGLAALQAAVAHELKLEAGPLVVHATYANYDAAAVGGPDDAKALIESARKVLAG